MQVGFVGVTGLMGHGMAGNILAAGLPLAYTLRKPSERVADLAAAGAVRVENPAALGRACDVVVLCVTSSADVEEVVTALLTAPREGLVVVDTSTSEPSVTRRLAADCAEKGVRFVDAPVTRGPAEAEAGTLNVMGTRPSGSPARRASARNTSRPLSRRRRRSLAPSAPAGRVSRIRDWRRDSADRGPSS